MGSSWIVILSEAKDLVLSIGGSGRSQFTTGCELKGTSNELPIGLSELRARSFDSLRMTIHEEPMSKSYILMMNRSLTVIFAAAMVYAACLLKSDLHAA